MPASTPARNRRSRAYTQRGRHVGGAQPALLVEHRVRDAQLLRVGWVRLRRVAAVEVRVRGCRAVARGITFEHRQAALAVRRVAVLDHGVEHQATAPGRQVDLVPVEPVRNYVFVGR